MNNLDNVIINTIQIITEGVIPLKTISKEYIKYLASGESVLLRVRLLKSNKKSEST